MRLLFYSNLPNINEKTFRRFDWFDFYRDAKEAIPENMPESRGDSVTMSFFVDANHGNNQKDLEVKPEF